MNPTLRNQANSHASMATQSHSATTWTPKQTVQMALMRLNLKTTLSIVSMMMQDSGLVVKECWKVPGRVKCKMMEA